MRKAEIILLEEFKNQQIRLDNHEYDLLVRIDDAHKSETTVLVLVSCLKNSEAVNLVKAAVRTIRKFTTVPYKLWIVDNNSPLENLKWLSQQDDINLVLNRTDPARQQGSYANAIGLELAAKLVSSQTKYFMALHQDVMAAREGWLKYLLSHFNDNVRAVGVREDRARVKEGILHVLGYVIDWQLFQKLKLNFFPESPGFDVGDKAIFLLKKAGYHYFATPNTMWNKEVSEKLQTPYKELSFDLSTDDNHNVIFMHLGRGVHKSLNAKLNVHKSIAKWLDFARDELGIYWEAEHLQQRFQKELREKPNYSLRRCFVDDFFFRAIRLVPEETKILDVGGKRVRKRGMFNVEAFGHTVEYVNIDSSTKPDHLCDAANICVPDHSFDCVILSEVIEHLENPLEAMKEAYRILNTKGYALISAPFNFHVHGDPHDYARYTDDWYRQKLSQIGFRNIKIEKHGSFFGVSLNMLRFWAMELLQDSKLKNKLFGKMLLKFYPSLARKSFYWDKLKFVRNSKRLSGYTTGYGIICQKS